MAHVGGSDAGNSNQQHVNINENITRIEAEIATTRARLVLLEQRLEDHKSLISPVRKAPVELLSAVFEFCNGEVWESSLRLAGVSKQWRETVISTPRAWTHVDLRRKPPAEILCLYVERSGSFSLHLALPPYDHSNQYCQNLERNLGSFSNRVTCLRGEAAWLQGIRLLNLRRLRVRGMTPGHEFTFSNYPLLRSLESSFGHGACLHPVAKIRYLHVKTPRDFIGPRYNWSSAIRQLGSTLVALKISVYPFAPRLPAATETFDLPRLRYLEISSEPQLCNHWEFNASTPLLQSYVPLAITLPNGTFYYTEAEVGNVTHLKINSRGSISLAPYLKLHYLCLGFHPVEIVEQLRMDHSLCPSLTLIEYNDKAEDMIQLEYLSDGLVTTEVIATIDRSHSGTLSQISVVWIPFWLPWSAELPYEISEAVRASVYGEDS